MTDTAPAMGAMPPVTVEVTKDGYSLSCAELSVTCVAPTIEGGYATLRELAANATKTKSGYTDTAPAMGAMPPVTVEVTKDGYSLSCAELSVTCVAPTIEGGYATLRELAANATKTRSGYIPLATVTAAGSAGTGRRTSRVTLLLIAGLLLPVVIVTVSVLNEARNVLGNIRQLTSNAYVMNEARSVLGSNRQLTSSLGAIGDQTQIARAGSVALARLADILENLTPERQQEMRHNLQRISIMLAPSVEGLRPLFVAAGLAEPQQISAPPSSSGGN